MTNQEMTFTYNALDQLVETKRGPPGAESILGLYDYNASGLRVRHRLSERGDVDYYYDDNAVIEERNAADDTLLAHYRYADRLISLDMGDAKQYYHHDALGSTVNLTTAEAEVQVSYKLDPWGHIREQSGSSVNRLIFTGQEHDENTGLIYFGSRYYDPDTARFISQDSYLGENNLPPSLHRYLYAYSNPTVYIDLHGYRPATPEEEALFKLREKASAEYQNAYEEKSALGRIGDRVFWGDYQKARILEYLNIRHKAAIDAAADGEEVFAVPNPYRNVEVDVNLGGRKTTIANSEFLTERQVKFLEHYSNLDAVASAPPAAVEIIFDPGDTDGIQFWARFWEIGTNAFTGKMSRTPNRTLRMTSESRSGCKEYVRSGDAKPAGADTNKNLANEIIQRGRSKPQAASNSVNKISFKQRTLIVDENLSPTLATKLRNQGYNVKVFPKGTKDPDMIEDASDNNAIAVTNNIEDFKKRGITPMEV
ncbi:MAG: RHS repeat-associated core domain-containing protein, partial [Planctomycetes bacterium]|nr:RHS repeat-associated core domain-containing protein [Planctomycetota bacterium]